MEFFEHLFSSNIYIIFGLFYIGWKVGSIENKVTWIQDRMWERHPQNPDKMKE